MRDLSRITETFTESVIREMTRICDALGGDNLSQGFPDFDAPEVVKAAAIQAIADGRNQYPVTFGEPELRDAIAAKVARYNGIACDPATDITVTCGATEAMIATMTALINPGDEVVIFEPFYENYGPDAILSRGDAALRAPARAGLVVHRGRAGGGLRSGDQGRDHQHAQQPHRQSLQPQRVAAHRRPVPEVGLLRRLRRDL